jgi:heat shock protein HslJ
MKSKSASLIVVVVLGLVLAACGTSKPLGPPAGLDGSWQLTSGTHQGTTLEPVSDHPVTMSFDGDEVTGTAACNGYGGTFESTEGQIVFSEMIITEMACFPTEVMDLEQNFMTALVSVTEVRVTDDVLVLSGENTILEFEVLPPVPTAELLNTVWVLDGLVTGDSVSSVIGDRATLELFSDGSFLGSTGCRSFNGTYTEVAEGLRTTDITPQGDCADDVSAQDSHVLAVLGGSYKTEIDTRSLYVTTSGELGLVYLAEG